MKNAVEPHEDDDRDPGVQPQAGELVRGIDPQQLLEEAPEGVVRDVEREQRRRPEAEAPVEQEQHARPRSRS